jgi:hypothetical protein
MKNLLTYLILFFSCYINSQNNTSFFPDPGKYIVSGWVKEIHQVDIQKDNYISYMRINYMDITATFLPSGEIIDGWQRIVGIIDLPVIPEDELSTTLPMDPLFEIELVCDPTASEAYFDDIRFFPYNGNLKSFVYDEATQRLMAELDENNYATFYEYDLEGGLVRVKKETEKGVFTIQETRSNNPKKEEN